MATTPVTPNTASDPIQEFINLPQDQQLSTLQALPLDKQNKLLDQVRQRKAAANTPPPTPTWAQSIQHSFDVNTATSPTEPLLETGLKSVVGAVGAPFAHPQQTLTGMANMVRHPLDTAHQEVNQLYSDVAAGGLPYAATRFGGSAFGNIALGEAGEALPRAVSGVAESGKSILTGGTKAAEKLNASTMAENATAAEKAAAQNAQIRSARTEELNKHFDAIQKALGNEETTLPSGKRIKLNEVQSHKEALNRGVERLNNEFQDALKATAKDAKSTVDAKYADVRSALEPRPNPEDPTQVSPAPSIPSADLASAVRNAESNLTGSTENIKQFRDILSKHAEADPDFVTYQGAQIPRGHPLYDFLRESEGTNTGASFRDLQGYYTELGTKLAQGNLLPDVYRAMKSLHDSIGEMMQGLADQAGVGPQLRDAQNSYREYVSAFRDPNSPLYKAIKAQEKGESIKQLQGKDVTGIQTLAKFNPELAKRANTIRGYQQAANSITSTPFKEKPVTPLSPKPAEVIPTTRTVGPEDIQAAKVAQLSDTAAKIRSRALKLGAGATGLSSLSSIARAFHGDIGGLANLPADVAFGGTVTAGAYGIANLLESPNVVKLLTKPTAADVATIDPTVARNLEPIVEAAKRKGIKVSPAIAAALSANSTGSHWWDRK